MTVSKFTQPDYTAEAATLAGAQAHMGKIEAALAVLHEMLGHFAPYASTPPDMIVHAWPGRLASGFGFDAATDLMATAVLSTGTLSAPTGAPRIDRIGLDVAAGTLVVLTGTEAASPVAPTYQNWMLPICRIALAVGQAVITNAHITDERAWSAQGHPLDVSPTGVAGAYNDVAAYQMFDTAGTYNVVKPAWAKWARLLLVAPGGGAGSIYYNAGLTAAAQGGSGGGGASIPNLLWAAEDLTVVIGAPGTGSASSYAGVPAPVNGGPGGTVTVTGVTTGITVTVNGGGGGVKATSPTTPGAGGPGGTAPGAPFAVGFAGGAGDSGGLYPPGWSAIGGTSGEQGQLGRYLIYIGCGGADGAPGAQGLVLIEWLP